MEKILDLIFFGYSKMPRNIIGYSVSILIALFSWFIASKMDSKFFK